MEGGKGAQCCACKNLVLKKIKDLVSHIAHTRETCTDVSPRFPQVQLRRLLCPRSRHY
jgi:hypothetical protein